MQRTTVSLPILAPPGAGLPRPELFFARLIFGWTRWRSDRRRATANFSAQRDAILQQVRTCNPADATQRVLIQRLRGLEDSSRHWSVAMTLDHLRIVNLACAGVIEALAAGRIPPGTASTATVKPQADVDLSVVTAFDQSCRTFQETVAAVPELATELRYAHPWFGPLDAAGWHVMAGFHMNLHRRQIERIVAGL